MNRRITALLIVFTLMFFHPFGSAGAMHQPNKEGKKAERTKMKQEMRTKAEYRKMNRENHKLRKKMYRESKRANRRHLNNVNSLGDVFRGT